LEFWNYFIIVCPNKVYYEAQVVHQPAVEKLFFKKKIGKLNNLKVEFLDNRSN
jgi:hypothetical protein